MFLNNFTLRDNKRCVTTEDQIKIYEITKEIRYTTDEINGIYFSNKILK